MGDRDGSGVNEPPRATLKKASAEKVDQEADHNLGSGEGFNPLEMVWYEENREKAEHGVINGISYHVFTGFHSVQTQRIHGAPSSKICLNSHDLLTSRALSHFRNYQQC